MITDTSKTPVSFGDAATELLTQAQKKAAQSLLENLDVVSDLPNSRLKFGKPTMEKNILMGMKPYVHIEIQGLPARNSNVRSRSRITPDPYFAVDSEGRIFICAGNVTQHMRSVNEAAEHVMRLVATVPQNAANNMPRHC